MRAAIKKVEDVTIVHLEGQLNFEAILPFRQQCINKLWGEKVVFNFESLNFVGSSGVTSFFECLKDFIDNNKIKPKFAGVQIEFQKLFEAWFTVPIEIYDRFEVAVQAYNYQPVQQPMVFQPSADARLPETFGNDDVDLPDPEETV